MAAKDGIDDKSGECGMGKKIKDLVCKTGTWYKSKVGLRASIVICLYAVVFTLIVSNGICKRVYDSKLRHENITLQTYGPEEGGEELIPFRLIDNLAYNRNDERLPDGQAYMDSMLEMLAILEGRDETDIVFLDGQEYTPSFDEIVDSIVSNEGFDVVWPEDSETGYGYIEAKEPGAVLVLNLPMFNSVCLSVEKNGTPIGLHLYDEQQEIDCWYTADRFQPAEEMLSQKLYFIPDGKITYLYKYFVAWYVGAFILIYAALLFIYCFLLKRMRSCKLLMAYTPKLLFIVLFCVQFLYTACLFYSNRDAYAVSGAADAYYYMSPEEQPQFLDAEGEFSLDLYVKNGWPHRGYIPTFVSLFFNGVSRVTGIDAMVFQFALTIAFSLLGICVALPALYKFFIGKEPKNVSILVSWIVFFLFWKSHFFYVLTDVPSAMSALMAMSFALRGFKDNRVKDLFLSGIFLGLASGYRAAYGVLAKAFLVVCIVVWLVQIIKLMRNGPKLKQIFEKTLLTGRKVLLVMVGMVLIMLPQLWVNIGRGRTTLFPYQTASSYRVMEDSYRSVTVDSLLNYRLGKGRMSDKQLNAIWGEHFTPEMGSDLSLGDAVLVTFSRPVEFSAGICKKLFYSLSNSGTSIYRDRQGVVSKYALYFLNYFMLGVFIIFLFKGRLKGIKLSPFYLFTGAVGMITWLLQVVVYHVETRYYLVIYMLIYFVFSYLGVDYVTERGEAKMTGFEMKSMIALLLFVIACYTAISTINVNFC